jgi:hypothetical protein
VEFGASRIVEASFVAVALTRQARTKINWLKIIFPDDSTNVKNIGSIDYKHRSINAYMRQDLFVV